MAVLAALKDNGVSVQKMTRWSGLHRSTIYRWMRGDGGQPDYDSVRSVASALWQHGYTQQARELVEASGYPWAEPQDEPVPVPELDDDPETLEALRRAYRDDPGKVREAAQSLLWAEGAATSGQPAGDESPQPGQRAG